MSPLHEAVEAGDLSRVQALVAAGADIEERQQHGCWGPCSPLFHAAEKGYVAVARYLIERGADKEAACNEKTSMIAATENGHTDAGLPTNPASTINTAHDLFRQ